MKAKEHACLILERKCTSLICSFMFKVPQISQKDPKLVSWSSFLQPIRQKDSRLVSRSSFLQQISRKDSKLVSWSSFLQLTTKRTLKVKPLTAFWPSFPQLSSRKKLSGSLDLRSFSSSAKGLYAGLSIFVPSAHQPKDSTLVFQSSFLQPISQRTLCWSFNLGSFSPSAKGL